MEGCYGLSEGTVQGNGGISLRQDAKEAKVAKEAKDSGDVEGMKGLKGWGDDGIKG
jgi:hypothetical protein